ncbi:MAG: alkaline phosphatase family protein [Candidatus Sulfotelmatobacter sp.]
MKSRHQFWWTSLCALFTLFLAACGGGTGMATQPPPPLSFQLSVVPPATGAGTVTSTPPGINCPTTCTASFAKNTQITLTATAGTNYSFGGWSGNCSGTGTCSLMITTAASVTAAFTRDYGLTVTAPPAGAGTVTSDPAGINCPTTCAAAFPQNTQVMLAATPGSNYSFAGWTGSCSGTSTCSLTMTGSASVTPVFNPDYGLTVTMAGTGTGTVTSSPAGINCPTTCSSTFPQSTQVTLSETPGANNAFGGWSGACTGNTTCSITVSGPNSVTATFGLGGNLQSLNHIIIFAQENRSFDHYFGAMRQYWTQNGFADQSFDGLPQFNPPTGIAPLQGPAPAIPGCDPTQPYPAYSACLPDPNTPVPSFHFTSTCQEEQSPFWNESHVDWDYNDPTGASPAALNGFVITAADDARQQSPPLMDTNGIRAMGYFDGNDLNYYYFMASSFATSDRWFSPVMDRTQINRMYLLAATSAGHVHPLVAPETPLPVPVIFEELQNAGITWKIYVDTDGTSCSSNPTAACLYNYSYINEFTYGQTIVNSPTLSQNLVPLTQYTTDLQNGTLPQVALIEPPSSVGLDEHPNDFDTSTPINVQAGANFASSLINGLMNSSSWKDSALIFTYDEAGGFYDHVSPQPMPSPDGIQPMDIVPGDICDARGQIGIGTCDFTYTGYRLPLIVISPFAKKNYVSHTVRDYTAILNLIETRFNVPALTKRDAAQADMSEFFDFVNVPWATPPMPPTQNTAGQCTLTPPTLD